MLSKDIVQMEGTIKENLPNTTFKVEVNKGHEVLCQISGRMRMNFIKLLPGDRVLLEVSPYDLTRGRIVRRL
ncbi:translation initiation factor IF-1 [bacterium (Candidatus Torokbacteria) CG_4_10_14_0_2_um_filter_35_8]|nr:MAG: translation initiation factor IF-1 [bacterium (Candidatus Torokbacteria) CG_4_10_14_0_2_um_filter_35_8]